MTELVLASFAAFLVTIDPEVNNAVFPTAAIVLVLLVVMVLTWGAMLAAGRIEHWLGQTGMGVAIRVLGLLLTALSAELILRGLKDSGVFR